MWDRGFQGAVRGKPLRTTISDRSAHFRWIILEQALHRESLPSAEASFVTVIAAPNMAANVRMAVFEEIGVILPKSGPARSPRAIAPLTTLMRDL